jgi:signal transduction histidine kinase
MALIGFIIAAILFAHYQKRLRRYGHRGHFARDWHQELHRRHEAWHGREEGRRARRVERARRRSKRCAAPAGLPPEESDKHDPADKSEQAILKRARRRARAEAGFYGHLMSYLGVIAFLALVNLMTTRYPWFLWPALGWGIGLFSHYMAVFGSKVIRERYFEPAVEREVRREKATLQTERQADLSELSSTIAHEIRNPIAAAKSLVQQMGEDPSSLENVEYAKVAIDELDRVERRISHLLKYAKEEDFEMAPVNLASVVDSALTQMRKKLDAAGVAAVRNYIAGPTIEADGEKLKQVFSNVLDNAIDALSPVTEGRRIDLFIDNGGSNATVRIRDNGAGIAPEKLDRVFTPFFTTKENGTGLGMAISRRIVEGHEGTIEVQSKTGEGTEFVVTLPVSR